MNVATWLERAGSMAPGAPAIAHGDACLADYRKLARRAGGIGAALRRRLSLNAGDRVAVIAGNHPAYLEVMFGIWWAGLVAVPVNSKLHPSEVDWVLEHAQARAVFVGGEIEPALARCTATVVPLDSVDYERMTDESPSAVAECAPDDLAWLFYTSGTTGWPKGAMLTHRNLATMSLAHLADVDPTMFGDALLHAAPLSHGSGFYALAHVCRVGVNVIPESGRFDPPEICWLLRTWARSSMFVAPTMLRRLVECPDDIDVGHIRTILWGGAPMHVPDILRALDRLGPCLAQVYGQGESPMTITRLTKEQIADRHHPRWRERLESAGVASSVVQVRVADGSDTAGIGTPGEVLVRGDTVMRGYWHDAEATARTLRAGWLHTGDIGILDDEGYLTLKGRSKDLIISGGSNIYPREVEEVLTAHPEVREVSVVGRPDPEWGEIVVAYVVGTADRDELDHQCLGRIARFKRPRDYVFVPRLPKNNYGKILKTDLRAMDRKRA